MTVAYKQKWSGFLFWICSKYWMVL